MKGRMGAVTVVAALTAIAAATLVPLHGGDDIPFFCLTCDPGLADTVLNVALFVPLGVGLRLAGVPLRTVVALGFATTLLVEAAQHLVVPGRDSSLRDLLANTLGAFAGGAAAAYGGAVTRPGRPLAVALAAAVALLFLGAQAFTTWALQPARSLHPWLFQIAPERRTFPDVFRGDVASLALGGRSVPVAWGPGFHASFGPGRGLEVVFVPGGPAAGLAPVVRVTEGPLPDGDFLEVAMLGQLGDGVAFRYRRRGEALGLRSPVVVLPGVVGAPGDTVAADGWLEGAALRVRARGARGGGAAGLEPGASWIGSLFLPVDAQRYGVVARTASVVWLLAVFGALGHLGAALAPDRRRLLGVGVPAAGGLMALGLVAVPLLGGLSVAGPSEWAAALAGSLAGALLAGRPGSGRGPRPGSKRPAPRVRRSDPAPEWPNVVPQDR